MAYIKKFDGKTDTTIQLGNKDGSKTNPVRVEGYFLGTRETPDTGYGPGKLHIFQTETGTVGVWGKTNSNRLLTQDLVGQMILLEFTGMGERKKGKTPAYEYSVQHDPNNTIDVSGIDLGGQAVDADEEEGEEPNVGDDDVAADEVAPVRASAPKKPAAMPNLGAAKAALNGSNARK